MRFALIACAVVIGVVAWIAMGPRRAAYNQLRQEVRELREQVGRMGSRVDALIDGLASTRALQQDVMKAANDPKANANRSPVQKMLLQVLAIELELSALRELGNGKSQTEIGTDIRKAMDACPVKPDVSQLNRLIEVENLGDSPERYVADRGKRLYEIEKEVMKELVGGGTADFGKLVLVEFPMSAMIVQRLRLTRGMLSEFAARIGVDVPKQEENRDSPGSSGGAPG